MEASDRSEGVRDAAGECLPAFILSREGTKGQVSQKRWEAGDVVSVLNVLNRS